MDDIKHTANYLASKFFGSKISLKTIYSLKTCHWAIIRYICDSIDKNYKKRKKFETKIYQSQIASFTYLNRKTVNIEIKHLIKKRLIKKTSKNTYTIGKVLYACNLRLHGKDVLPQVTTHRSVTSGNTSNSSNSSNSRKCSSNIEKQKQFADVEGQTTSYKKVDYVKASDEVHIETMKKIRKNLGKS